MRLERIMQIYAKCISGGIVSVVRTLLLFTAKRKLSRYRVEELYDSSVWFVIKDARCRGENDV